MPDSVRIDKWLWAVRAFKTRGLATDACRAGHVKIDGQSVKPAREVRVGDVITAYNGHITRTLKVRSHLEKRIGAKSVSEFLEDQTPPEEYLKQREPGFKPVSLIRRGKISKKNRRQLAALKQRL